MTNLRRGITLATVLGVALLVLLPSTAAVHAFDLPQHREITKNVLSAIEVTIAGRVRKFTSKAIEEIISANLQRDSLPSAAYFAPERHFTDEAFQPSTQLLIDHKAAVLYYLVDRPAPEGKNARG